MLDFSTCTECGRCQSQCPAWNTGKPLSPKLLIMDLRDHLFAKAPYIIGGAEKPGADVSLATLLAEAEHGHGVPESGSLGSWAPARPRRCGRWSAPPRRAASSTRTCSGRARPAAPASSSARSTSSTSTTSSTCAATRCWSSRTSRPRPASCCATWRTRATRGARRRTPARTGPRASTSRCPGSARRSDFEYLFWVGCAGAFDDGAKKTTRAVATLLHEAGVVVRHPRRGRDLHRRPGPPDGQRVRLPDARASRTWRRSTRRSATKEPRRSSPPARTASTRWPTSTPRSAARTRSCTTPSCWPSWSATGKLTPVKPIDGGVTYHDPCYLGRHNRVFAPPRELLEVVTRRTRRRRAGDGFIEMDRFAERSFCCGAGGARMWMEERIGKRDQHRAGRGGDRHRRQDDRRRLPVLPDHAQRRRDPEDVRRRGRGCRGRRRRHRPPACGQPPDRGDQTARRIAVGSVSRARIMAPSNERRPRAARDHGDGLATICEVRRCVRPSPRVVLAPLVLLRRARPARCRAPPSDADRRGRPRPCRA